MEIERKFLVDLSDLPFDPKDYPARKIEQAYLCTAPVVRIRRDNDDFFLTYKSKGMMVREEYNLPHKRKLLSPPVKSRRKDHYENPLCHPYRKRPFC